VKELKKVLGPQIKRKVNTGRLTGKSRFNVVVLIVGLLTVAASSPIDLVL
jgi:hypothetical protein